MKNGSLKLDPAPPVPGERHHEDFEPYAVNRLSRHAASCVNPARRSRIGVGGDITHAAVPTRDHRSYT
jgi:hypothetical protein